jgi:hypothetical protein
VKLQSHRKAPRFSGREGLIQTSSSRVAMD